MQLGILFWFYKDPLLCRNRLRLLRRRNPGTPVFGLFGGPAAEAERFRIALHGLLEDLWVFPDEVDTDWKWRHGDLMLARWYDRRGRHLEWDAVFVAQWDLLATAPLRDVLPPLEAGDMLISGLRPVREVESWWRWTRWEETRREYDELLAHVAATQGPVADPMCCQFIGMVLPRDFLERYSSIGNPELGFLEYKVPVYAQAFGIRLVPDTCFRPWWPEEPGDRSTRAERAMHAWSTPVPPGLVLAESLRPGGRRLFHPCHEVFPFDVPALGEWVRRRARRDVPATS